MDDHQAIAQIKQGDMAGLETLVKRYQDRAIRTAYLVCLDVDMAQDAAQDAFLRAFRRIDQFDDRRPFPPWFLRIVTNEALMALRRRKHSAELPNDTTEPVLSDERPSIEEMLSTAETHKAVKDALQQLSPKQRAAVVARYYVGLGEREMADVFACPAGTIKRRLHDARQRLRQLLPHWVHERSV
jgi:RNA polymerase sigma-70 factor, ECF subfamily